MAIALNPNSSAPYTNRAILWLTMRDVKRACIDAQKAADLGNPSTLDALKKHGLFRKDYTSQQSNTNDNVRNRNTTSSSVDD